MNFFEYTIEVLVDEKSEKITDNIKQLFISGQCPFNLNKMIDEEYIDENAKKEEIKETEDEKKEDEKKKLRTIIITSMYNIHQIIFDLFKGTNGRFRCYYKMPVAM